MNNEKAIGYLVKALRDYRVITYGQFDSERSDELELTQDAAGVIEELLRENASLKGQVAELSPRPESPEAKAYHAWAAAHGPGRNPTA